MAIEPRALRDRPEERGDVDMADLTGGQLVLDPEAYRKRGQVSMAI